MNVSDEQVNAFLEKRENELGIAMWSQEMIDGYKIGVREFADKFSAPEKPSVEGKDANVRIAKVTSDDSKMSRPVFGITARGNEAFYPEDVAFPTKHTGPQDSTEYEIFYGHICFGTQNPKGLVFRDYFTGLCSICKPSQPGINIAYFNKSDLAYLRKTIEQFRLNE